MALFRLFGAEIRNERQKALGLVSDDGNAWIAGVNPGEKLQVVWDGAAQCVAELPDALTEAILATPLLLPCRLLNEQSPATPTTSPKSKKPLIQENVLTPGSLRYRAWPLTGKKTCAAGGKQLMLRTTHFIV